MGVADAVSGVLLAPPLFFVTKAKAGAGRASDDGDGCSSGRRGLHVASVTNIRTWNEGVYVARNNEENKSRTDSAFCLLINMIFGNQVT